MSDYVFPTTSVDGDLFHIDFIDLVPQLLANKEGVDSFLDVATSLEDWRLTLFLQPPGWKALKPGNCLLDFNAISEEGWRKLDAWAEEQAYQEERKLWRSRTSDGDRWIYSSSLEEALFDAFHEEDIEEIVMVAPSDKLAKAVRHPNSADYVERRPEWLATVYANDVLGLDGVWWTQGRGNFKRPNGIVFATRGWQWERFDYEIKDNAD